VLNNLKAELAVPKSWISGAQQEGQVNVILSQSAANAQPDVDAFEQRYPGIKVNYTVGSTVVQRGTQPLVAFESGKYSTDVTAGISAEIGQFLSHDALTPLTDLPMWKYLPNPTRATRGCG